MFTKVNPRIVFCTLSDCGAGGPFRNMPDIGINVGPMLGATAILAGVIRSRSTGICCEIELVQADAAAGMDWNRIETDHARGNREPQTELRKIFHTRTCEEWIAFSTQHNNADGVLADLLGLSDEDLAVLRKSGAFG